MTARILVGDVLGRLRELADESVHCVVTSPPYWGLRDYGVEGQIGLEESPDAWCEVLVGVFAEVRRVLRRDGTLWVNLGDSYAGCPSGFAGTDEPPFGGASPRGARTLGRRKNLATGLKKKDLIGLPWLLAFGLRGDGWFLRSEIIWHKPNPMPESVTDRPTKAHEQLFLLSKSARYYYDASSVQETGVVPAGTKAAKGSEQRRNQVGVNGRPPEYKVYDGRRNKRTVWGIQTEPFAGAHFATFPTKLVEPCVLAGCPEGGTVLDPFCGAGTTGLVAQRLGRDFVGIELNPEYAEIARRRISDDTPLFARAEVTP